MMDQKPEGACMEDNYEQVRANAVVRGNEGPPLCFAIATAFDWGLSELSEPICMYRCGWEDDCNYYLALDDEDFKEMELESCAGQEVELEEGCYDRGFCSKRADAVEGELADDPITSTFWLWPYDAEDEQEAEAMSTIYYWIPQVFVNPTGCALTYKIVWNTNTETEWDDSECSEAEIEEQTCRSLKVTPTLF